jgi:hypothetical protein
MNRLKKDKDSAPEIFTIPLLSDVDCLDGNLWYVATLAYPNRSERAKRKLFVEGLRAWRIKPVYRLEEPKTRGRMRQTFPASDLRMKNEKINGVNHKGMKRVANRTLAGRWAWSLCSNSMLTLGPNPTTSSGIGIGQIEGMTTLVGGIRAYLSQKPHATDSEPRFASENPAEKNAWNLIWSESMPVLHLAVPWYLRVQGSENIRRHIVDLLLNPRWVVPALIEAEKWRVKLAEHIPLFDPDKAAYILPQGYGY